MSHKTNYTKQIISDYCVLDTETTGLSSYYDEIIEIGIVKVRDDKIVEQYSQLIEPQYEIPWFITEITGITNEMVADMPSISEVKEQVLSFIGDDIILGHNTSFDIRFLEAGFETDLPNKYMDTVQFSRKVFPELEHYSLSDMVEYLNLSRNSHRSMADCIATKELYDAIKKTMVEKNLAISDLWKKSRGGHGGKGINIHEITPTNVNINEDSFFYGRHVVFTGKLEKMVRKDAMQMVVNLGGILDNSVTKQTNYLILGDNDYNAILHGEKSSKHKKAEELKVAGNDIEIIDELSFYDILEEDMLRQNAEEDDDLLEAEECVVFEDDHEKDWRFYTRKMLDELVEEYQLPKGSLLLSDNKSKKNPTQTISHTVFIYEPDYPVVEYKPEQNKIVLTILLSTVKSRLDDLDLYIKVSQVNMLEKVIPNDATILEQTKTDLENRTQRIRFDKNSNNLVEFIKANVIYCIENYRSKANKFGCCRKNEECSRSGKCLHENLLYSKACIYRENLESGKVFY